MRRFIRIGVLAAQVGGSQEPLEAFEVAGWFSPSAFHVAAADPFSPWCNAYLVAHTVVARHSTHRVGAVLVVVARFWRLIAAGVDAWIAQCVQV